MLPVLPMGVTESLLDMHSKHRHTFSRLRFKYFAGVSCTRYRSTIALPSLLGIFISIVCFYSFG